MILLKDVSLECSVWLCIALGTDHYYFDGGEGGEWKFSHANIFLICGPCCEQFFLCVSVFLQTLVFSCIQFISVFTASANNLCQHFPTPPSPVKKNWSVPYHLSSVLYRPLHFKKGTKCPSEGTTPSC